MFVNYIWELPNICQMVAKMFVGWQTFAKCLVNFAKCLANVFQTFVASQTYAQLLWLPKHLPNCLCCQMFAKGLAPQTFAKRLGAPEMFAKRL